MIFQEKRDASYVVNIIINRQTNCQKSANLGILKMIKGILNCTIRYFMFLKLLTKMVLSCLCVYSLHAGKATDWMQFISTAWKHKQQVGAIAPFSRYTASSMLDEMQKQIVNIEPKKGRPIRILEAGAGNGALTSRFISYFATQGYPYELDAVELDPEFSATLREKFKDQTQVTIYNQDIATFAPDKKYDIIISTLPLNCKDFSPELVGNIMQKFEELAHKRSLYLSVEYMGMGEIGYYVFWDAEKRNDYDQKHKILNAFRKKYATDTKQVYLNMPPTYVYATHIKK